MLSLLPLIFLALAVHRAFRTFRKPGLAWDVWDALAMGAVATGIWAVAGAEVLSLFHRLDKTCLLGWWLLGVGALALWRRGKAQTAAQTDSVRTAPDRVHRLCIAIAGVFLLGTGVLALLTPPTTHDSLCYHLPRQLFWMQQQSVAHFPAPDLRQLEMPPFAEFLGVQLMILSGTDHQANMVQWVAFALGGVAAAGVAKELGAGRRGRWIACLLFLSQPMAAIQSLNPKNDVVCSFFALTMMYAAVKLVRGSQRVGLDRFLFSASLGLLILTKGTGYLLAAPFVALVGLHMVWRHRHRAILPGLAMGALACAINLGHWIRNYNAFGNPLSLPASRGGFALANEVFTLPAIVSNVVRNVSLHIGAPWSAFNDAAVRATTWIHRVLDIGTAEPATTLLPDVGFFITNRWTYDSGASQSIHLALIGLLFAFVAARIYRPNRTAKLFLAAGLAASFLFCLMLKWQPWHARLHVPFFAVLLPFVALWMESWSLRPLTQTVVGACIALGAAAVLYNETKPVLGKDSILFKTREQIAFGRFPEYLAPARDAVERLAAQRPERVGLALPAHSCEYMYLRMILDRANNPRLVSLHYRREVKPPRSEVAPEAVFLMTRDVPSPQVHGPSGTRYDGGAGQGPFYVLLPTVRPRSIEVADLAPFHGWTALEGLELAEGPFPQWELPLVRWAKSSRTRLSFESDGEPRLLLMDCRRNDRNDQAMTISINGQKLATHEFGPDWVWIPFEHELPTREGRNEIQFDYRNVNEPGTPRAVLFRRLQIIPLSWADGQSKSPGPSGQPAR